jgi:hypothetical protein
MSRGILFLRLEVGHLCSKERVLSGGNDALLRVTTELLSATRDHKGLLEVFKRLSQTDDLLGAKWHVRVIR